MSSLPGLTLEAFVAWQWNLVVQDQPENNFSLSAIAINEAVKNARQ